ncbi:MAG: cobyrinate a,c-diamide synthase [Desulfotomaculales bacterium]
MNTVPRVVVSAVQGRSGKTTVTAAMIAGMARRGLTVQAFKKGPDFIDPGWLGRVAGRPCRNLDPFMMDATTIGASVARHTGGADVAIVEGAMGLFDGIDLAGSGSTAQLAKILGAPVVLVINAARMTRSAAAVVLGCRQMDGDINLAGVIFNNVARPRHADMLRRAVEHYAGVRILGAIPKKRSFDIPDRHLGLVPVGEDERLHAALDALAQEAESHLDLDGILAVAGRASPLAVPDRPLYPPPVSGGCATVGVFRDRAFSFYYPENLEALEAAGARLRYIDALGDALPPVDALYIGGGFPEVLAAELEANRPLRDAVRRAVAAGLPVYAECGGLMYLGRSITWRGRTYAMSGALPFDVDLDERPRGHGYMVLEVVAENLLFPPGRIIRGHEFHHSHLTGPGAGTLRFAYRVHRGYGIDGEHDGLVYNNVLASYGHLHALATPEWAPALVRRAAGRC